jgi:F0F1-type ATP synthase assembly protein I
LRHYAKGGKELAKYYMPHPSEANVLTATEKERIYRHTPGTYLAAADKYRIKGEYHSSVNALDAAYHGIINEEKSARHNNAYDENKKREELKALKAVDLRIERTLKAARKSGGLDGPYEAKRAAELGEKVEERINNLEGKAKQGSATTALIGIAGLALGMFFLSPNLTGNVIGGMTNSTSNVIGTGLFIAGMVAGLVWINKKNK